MSDNLFEHIQTGWSNLEAVCIRTHEGDELTYSQLLLYSSQAANALSSSGVKPGDRIAVQVKKSWFALVIYIASLRCGAVYVPLNHEYTAVETEHIIRDCEPTVFVCDAAREAELREVAGLLNVASIFSLDDGGHGSFREVADAAPDTFETLAVSADALAAILYTSGTTGKPKGAMLTHGNLSSNSRTLVGEWRFSGADVVLHALPIFHTHGLFVAVNTVFMSGAALYFLKQFDLSAVVTALPQVTVMMGVPTFYSRLLSDSAFGREVTRSVRLFVSGSAPLPTELHREFESRCGHVILERYGMTETNMNTSNPYSGFRKAGTVGFPLPGVSVRIVDIESGMEVARGEVGQIEVSGPNVFEGYWRSAQKTAESFREDGYFITGDLGSIDSDGYLGIVGREKDLIISGGFNVYPIEVENVVESIDGVAECAVIGVLHPDLGEAVTGIVVLRKGAKSSEDEMRNALAKSLARYKVPRRILFVPSLPRNAMGKVQKNVLRTTYRGIYAN